MKLSRYTKPIKEFSLSVIIQKVGDFSTRKEVIFSDKKGEKSS
jgi:hypothetical protein